MWGAGGSVSEVRKSATEQEGLPGEPCGLLWGAPASSSEQAPPHLPPPGRDMGCWGCAGYWFITAEEQAARGLSRQAELFSEVGSGRALSLCSAELQKKLREAEEGRATAAAWLSRRGLDSLRQLQAQGRRDSTPPKPCQPTSQRAVPSQMGLGRHWILLSFVLKQWLSLQRWKERNVAPSTTPSR